MSVEGKYPSLHGRKVGITKDNQLTSQNGFVGGGNGKPAIVLPGSPDTTAIFEDFHGDDVTGVDTGSPLFGGFFVQRATTDTGNANDKQAGTNGVYRLFSTMHPGTPNAPTAGGKLMGLVQPSLDWKANQGPGDQSGRLRFGARVKMGTVSRTDNRLHIFAGFTDVTSIEMPAYDTGAGVISAAADMVGFLFSPGGDTGWSGVAVKSTAGDSGDQVVALDTGPEANIYDVIEVEISRGNSDTGGNATFFVNGVPAGRIDSPVASSVALAPAIYAFGQDTGTNYLDIDWVNVSAIRDTGL